MDQVKQNDKSDNEELIQKTIKLAIKEFAKEQRNEKRRKALHNTKLLLKSYNKIKESIDQAISEANQLEEQYVPITDADDLYIESIRRSKIRSLIVLAHIDKAMEIVKEDCNNKGYPEKFDAFKSCMIDRMNYEEAAEIYLSSRTSIGRWITEITKDISIQLFGVEGLDLI